MLRLVIAACALFALTAFTPVVISEAGAQRTTGGSATAGKRPNTRTARPPQQYRAATSRRGAAAGQFAAVRAQSGKAMPRPKNRVRGAGARGGGVSQRATVPGRNASANRGGRGSAARQAKGKPWSYYNRTEKRVVKRKPSGRSVTFRSSKSRKPGRPARRESVTSERLQRLGRTPGGQITIPGPGGANNAGNVLRAADLARPTPNIQVLQSPPRSARTTAQLTRHGRTKSFRSTKR